MNNAYITRNSKQFYSMYDYLKKGLENKRISGHDSLLESHLYRNEPLFIYINLDRVDWGLLENLDEKNINGNMILAYIKDNHIFIESSVFLRKKKIQKCLKK